MRCDQRIELGMNNRLERCPDLRLGNLHQHFGHEGPDEQRLRRPPGNPARLQVVTLLRIEPAHGGAMCALDIVREDLELRLGVHPAVVRQEQIAVGLLGVRLLRRRLHDHLAVEHRS